MKTTIKRPGDFIVADHWQFLVDAFYEEDFCEIASEIFNAIDAGSRQVRDYCEMKPRFARKAVHQHNRNAALMLKDIVHDMHLRRCCACKRFFLPFDANDCTCHECSIKVHSWQVLPKRTKTDPLQARMRRGYFLPLGRRLVGHDL